MDSQFNFHYFVPTTAKDLPQQGWKIHVSAFYDNYRKVLLTVAKYCYLRNIPFKYVLSSQLGYLLGKQASRLASGKLITIYPKDEHQFETIVTDLYKTLRHMHGPYVLTDQRYRDSRCLYYRYGTITRQNRIVYSKNGIPFEDASQPIYTNPTLATDSLTTQQKLPKTVQLKLLSEYNIIDVYRYTNFGGTYKATRRSDNKPVVIKEARAYLGESEQVTAIRLRQNEKEILERYAASDIMPQVIESFSESENYYLVMTKVNGEALSELKKSIYLGDISLNETALLKKVKQQVMIITDKLMSFFQQVHQIGLFLNDVSLENLMIDERGKITFIDAEASNALNSSPFVYTNTPEFNDSRTPLSKLTPEEIDNKRLGYVLIDLVCSANDLLKIDSTGRQTKQVFERFCELYSFPELLKIVAHLENWNMSKTNYLGHFVKAHEVTSEINEITAFAKSHQLKLPKKQLYEFCSISQINDVLDHLQEKFANEKSFEFNELDAHDLLNITQNLLQSEDPISHKKFLSLLVFLLRRMKANGRNFSGTPHYLFTNEAGNYSPYIASSGAVLLSSLKFLKQHQDAELINLVKEILPSFDGSIARNVSYLYGLSGIADLFLNAYEVFGDHRYLLSTMAKFRVIQSFRAVSSDSWLYADKSLHPNFGTYTNGTPGILAFYQHLQRVLQINEQRDIRKVEIS
ncbi:MULTISPECIES: class III lanthionine synthetase LanKC N-terminal domain-containing protein [Lacticaseibacillus]|uniref:class III lanthionine synthetase LanKC N-terminal domain-containing protein n=1 Tax=Lacticaseibacillus TaxID=2759736 RepID=UPI00063DC67D|nr:MULTISPECIES: hypothetical protein [Lacticaseibacillus]KLI75287.1 hypothetical protein AAW28_07170 [Lacticaseibacillus casei]